MQLLTYSRTTEQKLKDSYKTLKDVDNVIKQTTSQGEKLKKKTLKDFKENKKIIDDDIWVCQADSLYRIKPTEKPLEILVLDEVDQLRKHMTADTFMKNSNYLANRAGLRQLIKTAKQVIIFCWLILVHKLTETP